MGNRLAAEGAGALDILWFITLGFSSSLFNLWTFELSELNQPNQLNQLNKLIKPNQHNHPR